LIGFAKEMPMILLAFLHLLFRHGKLIIHISPGLHLSNHLLKFALPYRSVRVPEFNTSSKAAERDFVSSVFSSARAMAKLTSVIFSLIPVTNPAILPGLQPPNIQL
jgi:hypothetical protein